MAHIRKEQVNEKREKLKQMFPTSQGWKFSIRTKHFSTIVVTILKAPINLLEGQDVKYKNIHNQHRIESEFKEEIKEVLTEMFKIINNGNYNNSDTYTDYFDVGFYVDFSIGAWDKDFVFEPNKKYKGIKQVVI